MAFFFISSLIWYIYVGKIEQIDEIIDKKIMLLKLNLIPHKIILNVRKQFWGLRLWKQIYDY